MFDKDNISTLLTLHSPNQYPKDPRENLTCDFGIDAMYHQNTRSAIRSANSSQGSEAVSVVTRQYQTHSDDFNDNPARKSMLMSSRARKNHRDSFNRMNRAQNSQE